MEWVYLGLAAVFEVIFAMGMKYAKGFTKLVPSIITVVGAAAGIAFLTLALKTLPVSVAYPIWTAIGTLGTVILGYVLLKESLSALKIASAIAVVAGITGLKIAGA